MRCAYCASSSPSLSSTGADTDDTIEAEAEVVALVSWVDGDTGVKDEASADEAWAGDEKVED